ncbi:MAG: sulfatase [Bacteroidota bacterium]
MFKLICHSFLLILFVAGWLSSTIGQKSLKLPKQKNVEPKNVIFILSDDHRYDFMGFTGKVPWLKTPNMDKMAAEGAHCPNTFVTTSLCSPSRASILTGLFSHAHTIVDNSAPDPGNLIYFPQYLQKSGYQTAFIGKWHMGDKNSNPRPGFDHWVSFKGQGLYYNPLFNINGQEKQYTDSAYTSDLLTDHTLEFLDKRDQKKPFFVYLSHKAVHAGFQAAKRHKGQYADDPLIFPPTYYQTQSSDYIKGDWPEWVKKQRYSWHGVDYMYHGAQDFDSFFRAYCETLSGVDESIGRVLDYLEKEGLDDNTVVFYMGDNGFSFGEHGLIDKRHFYEESAKVPFLVRAPGIIPKGITVSQMIQNIDVAPTILELAGLESPMHFHGQSAMPILQEKQTNWRDRIFYEYYWEIYYPQTPTMHGVRTDRYKYIMYHGLWDKNELYDLQEDPNEMVNLIKSPEHQEMILALRNEIYDWLEETGGMQIPLKRTIGKKRDYLNKGNY